MEAKLQCNSFYGFENLNGTNYLVIYLISTWRIKMTAFVAMYNYGHIYQSKMVITS